MLACVGTLLLGFLLEFMRWLRSSRVARSARTSPLQDERDSVLLSKSETSGGLRRLNVDSFLLTVQITAGYAMMLIVVSTSVPCVNWWNDEVCPFR